jgi:outer membrane scaffolding protein for murein synthesis (MipA/OmpV family)
MLYLLDEGSMRPVSEGLYRMHLATSVFAALALCLLTGPVLADSDDIMTFIDLEDDLQETPGFDTRPANDDEPDWDFRVGAMVGFKPEYEGSDDYESVLAPNWRVAWRRTVILQGKNLRVQYTGDNYRVGALVGGESGRDEDDNDNLEGLGDVDSGWSAGLFGRYDIDDHIRLQAEGRQEFSGGHGGLVVDAGAEVTLPFDSPLLRVYAGVTYASSDYMEEFFSISGKQSANSGKPTYDADAGIKNVTLALSAGYDITDNWVIGAIIRYERLVGDAADSPIVKSGGNPNQFTGGASIAYQF